MFVSLFPSVWWYSVLEDASNSHFAKVSVTVVITAIWGASTYPMDVMVSTVRIICSVDLLAIFCNVFFFILYKWVILSKTSFLFQLCACRHHLLASLSLFFSFLLSLPYLSIILILSHALTLMELVGVEEIHAQWLQFLSIFNCYDHKKSFYFGERWFRES